MQNSVSDPQQTHTRHRFHFKGETGEFFGIWFVNSILNMFTIGLYSPWAKVRTLQYFYGNTSLAGGHFQFLANPFTLFKSRLIAVALFVPFFVIQMLADSHMVAMVLYLTIVVLYFVLVPVLLVYLMSFRLRYSAWRGITFNFNKDFKGSYRVYLAPVSVLLLLILSIAAPFYVADLSEKEINNSVETVGEKSHPLNEFQSEDAPVEVPGDGEANVQPEGEKQIGEQGTDESDTDSEGEEPESWHFLPALIIAIVFLVLLPYFDFINLRYLARNARFGTAKVNYLATVADYYSVYGKWLVATLLMVCLWIAVIYLPPEFMDVLGISTTTAIVFMSVLSVFYYYLGIAFLSAKRYNLLMNNLEIGVGHCVQANASFLRYFWLMFTNSLGITISFGLLRAWAMVRTASFFLNCTSLLASGDLDEFAAAEKDRVTALIEEGVDVFDVELV